MLRYHLADKSSRIPERALWCVFEALSGALCLLSNRRLPTHDMGVETEDDEIPKPPVIFHRDLKPYNIFLADPSKETWSGVPMPKVSALDFVLTTAKTLTVYRWLTLA
jgi:serine/threonine protein kinase